MKPRATYEQLSEAFDALAEDDNRLRSIIAVMNEEFRDLHNWIVLAKNEWKDTSDGKLAARIIPEKATKLLELATPGDLRLLESGPTPDGKHEFKINSRWWVNRLVASNLGLMLLETGAVNYLETTFHHDTKGDLILTVQVKSGKTPNQLKVEAETERDRLRVENDRLTALVAEHESELARLRVELARRPAAKDEPGQESTRFQLIEVDS